MTEEEPKIIHTLKREPHVTLVARDANSLSAWVSLAVSPKHGLFLADLNSYSIYQIQHGRISMLVSPPSTLIAGDFHVIHASSMVFSATHNALLVTDHLHHVIRSISLNDTDIPSTYGTITTFAGSSRHGKSKPGFSNGVASRAKFRAPSGIFATIWGDVLVSDTKNHAIRLIRGDTVSTLAGQGKEGFLDGYSNEALFNAPQGLTCSAQGEVFVCDVGNRRIRMIEMSGYVSTLAGSGEEGLNDGNHLEASFVHPERIFLTPHNDLIVIDHHIRVIRLNGGVTTLAESTEDYIKVFTDIRAVKCKKRSWREKILQILSAQEESSGNRPLTSNLTWKKTVVVTTTKDRRFCLSRSRGDPSSPDYAINDAKHDFADEHTTFSSLGDLAMSLEGDLIFTDPATNSVKQIQGVMSLLYPWKSTLKKERLRIRAMSFDDGSIAELEGPTKIPFSVLRKIRSVRANPPIDLTRLLERNPFVDYEIRVPVMSTRSGQTSSRIFRLHALILFLVCPILLTEHGIQALHECVLPEDCYTALFKFLYGGALPLDDEKGAQFWSDFAVLARTLRLGGLGQHACYRLYKALERDHTLESAMELLKRHPDDAAVFDAISEHISSLQEIATRPAIQQIKRRLSYSDADALKAHKGNTLTTDARPLAHSSSSLRKSSHEWPSPPPTVKAATSMTSMVAETQEATDLEKVAERVLLHLNRGSSDIPLHQRNKVDVFDILQTRLLLLGTLLSTPKPMKDAESLVPFPELHAPDFFLHTDDSYVPCHGCVLYARWPWFAERVDRKCSTTYSTALFAPFRPSAVFTCSAPHTPAGRVTRTFSNSSILPSRPSTLESISMRVTKTFERERSVDLPFGALSPEFTTGLVWYLYSNELHRVPQHREGLKALSYAATLGWIDEELNPIPPFYRLIQHLREPLSNPITVDNCFNLLKLYKSYGYPTEAYRVKNFIAEHATTFMQREDLRREFYRLPPKDLEEVLTTIPVSAPLAPEPLIEDDEGFAKIGSTPADTGPALLRHSSAEHAFNTSYVASSSAPVFQMTVHEHCGGESIQ